MRELVMLSDNQRLLKAPAVHANNGLDFEQGNLQNKSFRAWTGQDLSLAGDRRMMVPFLNWSVLDFGRCKRILSLVNSMDCRDICEDGEVFRSHVSHVNLDERRNAAKAIQNAV